MGTKARGSCIHMLQLRVEVFYHGSTDLLKASFFHTVVEHPDQDTIALQSYKCSTASSWKPHPEVERI